MHQIFFNFFAQFNINAYKKHVCMGNSNLLIFVRLQHLTCFSFSRQDTIYLSPLNYYLADSTNTLVPDGFDFLSLYYVAKSDVFKVATMCPGFCAVRRAGRWERVVR